MRNSRLRGKRPAFRCLCIVASLFAAGAYAATVELDRVSTPDTSGIVGMGFDSSTQTLWAYASFGAELRALGTDGVQFDSVARPGNAANDVDVDIAPESLTLNGVVVPAGTILFTDGESGVAEVYAIDPATGVVLSSLTTDFGVSHIVGGAYSAMRDTLFLLQDRVPPGVAANRIAEIDPATGVTLNSFVITDTAPDFTINFGDLDVSGFDGNLYIVSSVETQILVLTPDTGAVVSRIDLPVSVGALSAIALDDVNDDIWVANGSGVVSRLAGANGDTDQDTHLNSVDNCLLVANVGQTDADGDGFGNACDADYNNDCVVNVIDLGLLRTGFFSADPNLDLNGDGVVNVVDLGLFRIVFFDPPGPSCSPNICD